MEESSSGSGFLVLIVILIGAMAVLALGGGSTSSGAVLAPAIVDGLAVVEGDGAAWPALEEPASAYSEHEDVVSGVPAIDEVGTNNSHAETRHFADVTDFWSCFSSGSFSAFQVDLNNFIPAKNESGRALQVCVFEPRTEDEKGKVFVRVIRQVKDKWYELTLYREAAIGTFVEAWRLYVENNPNAVSAFTLVNAMQLPTE